jgi:hypothetical protein
MAPILIDCAIEKQYNKEPTTNNIILLAVNTVNSKMAKSKTRSTAVLR